jgi:hypothetical protein
MKSLRKRGGGFLTKYNITRNQNKRKRKIKELEQLLHELPKNVVEKVLEKWDYVSLKRYLEAVPDPPIEKELEEEKKFKLEALERERQRDLKQYLDAVPDSDTDYYY